MQMKETSEAIVAVSMLVKEILKAKQDGLALSDATALATKIISDVQFRTALVEGFSGIGSIPAEFKSLISDMSFEKAGDLLIALGTALKKA